MALYICDDCGSTFDHPAREHYGGESWSACPDCGCPDFEAAAQCRGCRKDLRYGELIAGEYCADCVDHALDRPDLVEEYMNLPDVRENFAEFLAEMQWTPNRAGEKA